MLTLDDSVAPTHTDIVDSYLTLMTSAKLELTLLGCDSQKMDVSRSVFVQRHGLKQNVVAGCILCNLLVQVDNLIDLGTNLKRVGVHLLADFALKALPVV